MMKFLLSLLFLLCIGITNPLFAQLPNGSIAPNFTLTDINGNSHTLYNYLDQGKMVILEFSATWCGPCWNYMQTGIFDEVWEDHGPNGDNTVMMLYIEADQSTGMADLLGQTASSQGNWVAEVPFPIIDLQVGDNQDVQYQIGYYPTLFAICSDYTVWELGQVSAATWSSFITSCTLEGEIEEIEDALCYGEGSVTAGYSGGVPPVTYEWSTGEDGPVLSNVPTGSYQLTITDDGGKWVVLEDIIVEGVDAPISLDQSFIEEPLCNGASSGQIDIEIEGGAPGYSYDWSNGATTEDLSNVPAGDYTVSVVDDNGCEFEESFFIDEPSELEADAEVSPEHCNQEDGFIELNIDGGTGGYEVSASTGDVFGYNIQNLSAGNVTVTIEDDNGCIWEEVYNIAFVEAPTVSIQQAGELSCLQPTTALNGIATNGSGDYDYAWTTSNGNIVSGSNQATAIINAPGTYHLLVVDFDSGCETSSEHVVTANIVFPEVDAGADLPISCENNLPTLQGVGDINNTVNWTTLNGNIVSGGTTYTPIVDQPGQYYIQVTIPATGCSSTDTVDVLNQLNPATALYQYQTSNLTLITTDISTGSNLSGWSWTFGDGGTSTSQSPIHTYTAAGIYEVCLSVQNGCGISQTCSQVEVTTSGSILSLNATVNHVLCHGDTTGLISLIVNGGSGNYTYLWTGPDSTTYNTPEISNLPAGSYLISVTDDQGNSVLGGFTIEQPELLNVASSTITDNICYAATNGVITVEHSGGVEPYTYSWNGDLTPGQTNTINQLSAGLHALLITDANGCQLLNEFTVSQPAEIVSEQLLTHVLCHGEATGAATLNVQGGVGPYTYAWSENENHTNAISGLLAGNYTSLVTDANGCIKEFAVIIEEPAALSVTATEIHHASGADVADGSITLTITGGTSPYTINWDNGATGPHIEGLLPGTYTYSIVDSNGCVLQVQDPVVISHSVSTNRVDPSYYLSILPNPSNGNVTVEWKNIGHGDISLSLHSMDGITLDKVNVNATEGRWDLSQHHLADGVYVVLLSYGQDVYPVKLVVVGK